MASKISNCGRLAAKNSELYYEQEGNISGPAVLFVHGLGGTTNTFQPILATLQESNIVRFDWSGHGRSSLPKTASIESYVDDCIAIIENFNLKDITVVAHSLGGLIALHLAANYPSLISRLILFGPVKSPSDAKRRGPEARAEIVRSGGMAAVADTVISGALPLDSLSSRPEVVGFARELLCRQDPEGYAMACMALSTSHDPEWNRIEATTTIVSGGEDQVSNPIVCQEIADHLEHTNAKLISFAGVGHWHTLEAPAKCGELVREIVSQ